MLGISATATTTVQIEAVNGFTRETELNNRGIHLADDLGNGDNFVDPEQNSRLAVPPGGTLTGTLTFLGRVEPRASTLRLLINTFEADETVDIKAEKPDAKQTLSDVAEVIAFYAAAPVSVRGHTDSVGADDVNQDLSERRAAAVVAALTDTNGVAASRLTAKGFGETSPVSANADPDGSDNPAGRQQNRRVARVLEGVTR